MLVTEFVNGVKRRTEKLRWFIFKDKRTRSSHRWLLPVKCASYVFMYTCAKWNSRCSMLLFSVQFYCMSCFFCFCTTSDLFGLFSKDTRLLKQSHDSALCPSQKCFCISCLHDLNHQIVFIPFCFVLIIKQMWLRTGVCCVLCLFDLSDTLFFCLPPLPSWMCPVYCTLK